MTNKQSYRARFIYSGDSPPLEDAVIEIQDGIVTALAENSDHPATNLGNVAIIPGLINTHTHLEFSHLAKPVEPLLPFTNWIRNVVSERRNRKESASEIVIRGMQECIESGQTTLGEISTADGIYEAIPSPRPRTVVFREILGLNPADIETNLQTAQRHLERLGGRGSRRAETANQKALTPALSQRERELPALSPHAPYSVHPELFHKLIELAIAQNIPVAMHLAETQAELQLLDKGEGEFVAMLQEFGVWQNGIFSPGTKPMEYLKQFATVSHALVVHGNYLNDEEITFLATQSNMTLVYCPRTHAAFGHPHHPWQRVLKQGGNVAIGTDSRASNPDLSLWNELCFLKNKFPDSEDTTLLRLGTSNGARALGLEHKTGSLQLGKAADLAIVKLTHKSFSTLFNSHHRICGTMLAGDWIFRERLQ